MKIFYVTLFVLVVVGSAVLYYFPHAQQQTQITLLQKQQDVYTILFAGDVMLDRGVAFHVARHGDGDWRFPWHFVADRFSSADLVFLNHEGVMSDVGKDAGGLYSFNFPLAALDGLLFAGVDVVSLANNHSFDWGGVALCDTKRRLNSRGVGVVGAGCSYTEANAPYVHVFNDGSSVGFLGYTSFYPSGVAGETHPGISDYALENMQKSITALRERVDLIFVSLHWGEEYQLQSNVGQQRIARALIDVGADAVIGHHPHVIQEVEEYNGGWIFYSLGNFIFDQYFSPETMEGLVASVTVQDGAIASVTTEKVFLNTYFQPSFSDVE